MDDYPLSIFDRLTDPSIPRNRCRYSRTQLEAGVLRDLEDLLNTKRAPENYFQGLERVERSIVNFGLRDATHRDGTSPELRASFAAHMKEVIETYEPRLTNVRVLSRDPDEVKNDQKNFRFGVAYFRIVATLNVDPTPIHGVVFETTLELSTGKHNVNSGGTV